MVKKLTCTNKIYSQLVGNGEDIAPAQNDGKVGDVRGVKLDIKCIAHISSESV